MVRGKKDLTDALFTAVADAWKVEGRPRPVSIVIDVTPFTAAAAGKIVKALVALDGKAPAGGTWRVGALGKKLRAPVDRPGRLVPKAIDVLGEETPEVSTIGALRRTLRSFPARGGIVVYLADWRFEDDENLEKLISELRGRDQSFRVVGTEAAFGRPWNDGFYPPDRGARRKDATSKLYADGIGRSPFGPEDPEAPWHGGDTAWPHLPFRFRGPQWATEFHAELPKGVVEELRRYAKDVLRRRAGNAEDLDERLKPPIVKVERTDDYFFPVSSSFGPYGLMRVCAQTGGRYVLWSWNPYGRSDLEYDWSKCGLFAPNLRSRAEIRKDILRRPLALALVRAWHALAKPKSVRVADSTPPLRRDARTPQAMEEFYGDGGLPFSWHERGDHVAFLARARRHLRAHEEAIAFLEGALAGASKRDAIDRRYGADAALLLHTLRVLHFELKEAYAEAQDVPEDAWDHPGLVPGLESERFIHAGRDPEGIEFEYVRLNHEEAGERLVEHRRRFLDKFLGTPFGEIVARNGVVVYRFVLRPIRTGPGPRRSPSESKDPQEGTPTPPTSRGGGPSTGG
jgi:hypothetical protein